MAATIYRASRYIFGQIMISSVRGRRCLVGFKTVINQWLAIGQDE